MRPLLHTLYRAEPAADVHVFYVPDDFASGAEPAIVRALFPQAHVYDAKAYLRFALGRSVPGMPDRADVTLYLGGDLMHAARIHRRLDGRFASYRFTRRKYARRTARAFAIDERDVRALTGAGIPRERVELVGNLAIDGAFLEASAPPERGVPAGGILFMPGSRRYEVEHMLPFFFTTALSIRREAPHVPIAFGISPFTSYEQVRVAVERGGTPLVFAKRGALVETPDGPALSSADGAVRFPLLRNALAAAARARLTVATPGTKMIELAAIGAPVLSCTPLNMVEAVTIFGPLTYLDRIPFIGVPLKRAFGARLSRMHRYHVQPNIDAQREIVRELHGTLTPGRVAHVALDCWKDTAWLTESSQALRGLYTEQVGAAERMARGLLGMVE